jgi:hypothetical protein
LEKKNGRQIKIIRDQATTPTLSLAGKQHVQKNQHLSIQISEAISRSASKGRKENLAEIRKRNNTIIVIHPRNNWRKERDL